MGLLESSNGKNGILTVVFASMFLVSIGLISHNAFAMGSDPSTCNNLYSGTITSFLINNGSQTFDAVANPGVTFNVNTASNYNTTFVIRAASESTFNNTNSGYTWYNTNAPAFWWGACVGSVGSNQNATAFEEWIDPHTKYEEFTQGVSFQSYNGNTVSYTVNWIPSSTSSSSTTAPSAPQNLTATVSTPSQINLSWTPPSNNGGSPITGYEVERAKGNLSFGAFSNSTSVTFFSAPNATAFSDKGLDSSTTYNYTIFAKNSAGASPPSNAASATTSATTSGTNFALLGDTFDNGLSGWQYYGSPGYQLSLDNSTGVPAPSAHISGDITASTQCGQAGIAKVVDISSYTGGNLTLGFNWRASSGGGDGITNAHVRVNDGDTGASLFNYQLASGSLDTGWQHYSNNIASYLLGDKRLEIVLYLNDCWQFNYDQNNWYDNISLVWNNSPIAPNAPTSLKAAAAPPSQINLSWTPPLNDGGSPVTGYRIERSTDFGYSWTTIVADTHSAGTTYSDTGLGSGYYTYHVSAINAIGTGKPSNLATANTAGGNTVEYSSSSSFTGTVNSTDIIVIDKGATLSTNGITNYGIIKNMGTIQFNSTGQIDNHNFIFNAGGVQIGGGTINNFKSAEVTSEGDIRVGTLNNYGVFNGTLASSYGYKGPQINNYGNFTTYGGISTYYGYINNYQTGVMDSYNPGQLYNGLLNNYGLVNSHGSITLTCSGIGSNGTFNNYASILLFSAQCGSGIGNGAGGTFNNHAGSEVAIPGRTGGYVYSFSNAGTVNNDGSFYNNNFIGNHGIFNNNGNLHQSGENYGFPMPTLANYGTFNNNPSGIIQNGGMFDNQCNAIYANSGSFTGNAAFGACTTNQVISINPTSGPAGTQVTVAGNNFMPNHVIAVTFDSNQRPTSPSMVTSNSTGGFVATFAVPPTNRFGQTLAQGSAYDVAATDSAYSAAAAFAVTAPPSVPSAPQNLVAAPGNAQVSLSWNTPSSGGSSAITGYYIYRGTATNGEATTPIGSVSGSTLTYNDTGLANGQTYYYAVKAVNSVGTSPASNEASATPTSGSSGTTGMTLNNVQSTSGTVSASNQITIPSFNVGTGSNRLLVVGVSANNNNVASITYGGVPLAMKAASFFNNDAELWYLDNPGGSGDVVVTMNGPTQAVVGAYSFSGVNQTSPIATAAKNHNTSPSSPHISITTKYANDWIIDLPSIYGGSTLGSPTCTQQWDANVPNAVTGASSSAIVLSPATVTCKWTASSADFWDDVAVELRSN